jgi:tetratricopeptide (TPR) repeat protein
MRLDFPASVLSFVYPMFLPKLLRFLPVFVALLAVPPMRVQAQTPGTVETRAMILTRLKNAALQYFEGGKYPEAIKNMEEFLGMLTEPEKQQDVSKVCFLLLAESYLRLGKEDNQNKAITYWQEFMRRWPADPLVLQIKTAIAQVYMSQKKWEVALEWWVQVETMAKAPEQLNDREYSLKGQAFCYQQLKDPEKEIVVLERMVYPDFNTPTSAEGAVRLMTLYALKHDPADKESMKFADKAVELLKKLQTKIHLVENFIALNSVAIKLGDELMDVHAFTKALEAYWAVRSRDVVAALQRQRIKDIELRMDQNIKAAGGDPIKFPQAQRQNELIKPYLEEAKKILGEFEKVPDFMPALYFRMARCHMELDRKWEAIVVFNQILDEFPQSSVRELVVFSRLAMYADLGIAERTYAMSDEYIKEYPTGPHVGEVAFIRGATAMKKKDWVMAEKYFEEAIKILATVPEDLKKLYWTEARYQVGNAKFLQNTFDVAMVDFNSFIAEFGNVAGGKGANMEDVEYELALCHLFTGHYQQEKPGDEPGAIERLKGYLSKWGERMSYSSDAKYRLGVCQFAAYEYADAIKTAKDWFALYENKEGEMLHPEVYALLGDCYAGNKQPEEAGDAYVLSYKHKNVTEEVLAHSLFEAGKQYQKAGNWEKIEKIYTEFVQQRPDHPQAVSCIYWMGKAKAKLGRMEEAKKITVEALVKHVGDPKMESCEMMLSQLADWSRRRPQQAAVSTNPDGVPTKWDAEAELERMVKPLRENANKTTEFRLRYVFGELQRLARQPAKRAEIIAKIADEAKPEDLSPHLLMECGDSFMARGDVDKAEVLYRKLKEDFRKAERVDAGWVGLADVAYALKDYKKAMENYTYAIDRLGAPWKLKEALLGQAKCQVESAVEEDKKVKGSGKALFEKAKKTFEEVASVREWRGETTAMALWHIADVQYKMELFPEATAGWERITASQNRYPVWVARSYLSAAQGYFRQGKDELAKAKLRELIDPRDEKGQPDEKRLEKFKDLPEFEMAKKKLDELNKTV